MEAQKNVRENSEEITDFLRVKSKIHKILYLSKSGMQFFNYSFVKEKKKCMIAN